MSQKSTKYQQLATSLEDDLIAGARPHSVLPSERDLMARYEVSRMTVRAALTMLADKGKVYRIQGAGTFVSDIDSITKSIHLTSFSEDIAERNMKPGSRVVAARLETASAETARDLGLSPGDPVMFLERVRTADGLPICIERSWLPCWLLGSDPSVLEVGSLYELLSESGAAPEHAEQTISASILSKTDAENLEVEPHSAALVVDRLIYDIRGRRVEVSTGTYRWDRYQYNITVKRKNGV